MATVRVSPLWRRAPMRYVRAGVGGVLLVLAIGVGVASAASAPLFAQSVGDHALQSVLEAVPDHALAQDAPVVRLVGGQGLRRQDQALYVGQLARIPGLGEPVVTGVSVTPEVDEGLYPVVSAGDVTVPARLAAVPDPAASLVVTSSGDGDVWLPDPLAEQLGVGPGDTVQLRLAGEPPPDAEPSTTDRKPVTVRVAGTYAVRSDGRGPADPPGTTAWSARRGAIPSDTDIISRAAWLVVADPATVEGIAETTGDQVLWAVESRLDPSVGLQTADRTAAAVDVLRRDTRSPQSGDESVLRVGLVSGVEKLVDQADRIAEASTRRARLWSGAGVLAGLVAVLVVAMLGAADRRRELGHSAATGVGPWRTAGLWSVETLPPAGSATVLGVAAAVLARALLAPTDTHSDSALPAALLAGGAVAVAAVLLVGVVALVATAAALQPEDERTHRRAPWLWVLAVATGVALLGALTGPAGPPGPVELAVPILLAATVGTVLAVLAGLLARRFLGSRRLPSPGRAGPWLSRRRIAALGPAQVLVVAALTVGLATAMFAAAAVQATRAVVADRQAVAAGAPSTASLEGSWQVDPTAPTAPTAQDVADGAPVPEGHSPVLPDDEVAVWRTQVAVSGLFGYRDLLIADPTRLADVAAWGRGPDLAATREQVRELAAPVAAGDATPVIAVGDPTLHAGDTIMVSGQDWQLPAEVVASVDTFPGRGEAPMLVAADDAWLGQLGWGDPRLQSTPGSFPPRPHFDAALWSTRPVDDLVDDLERQGVTPQRTTSADQASRQPSLVAATFGQGYQAALALFLVVGAVVAAALYAARTARRQRAVDLMLARVGMTARGVRRARTGELVALVLLAAVGAAVTLWVVRPLGRLLLDLDPDALPRLRLTIGPAAWLTLLAATAVVLLGGLAVSWWDARVARRPGSSTGEEAVLRAAD